MAKRPSFLLFLFVIFFSYQVFASYDRILHGRYGAIYGDYRGPTSGNFFVPTMLDLETEWFITSKRSLVLRFMMAVDVESAKNYYTYAGSGMRFSLDTHGTLVEESEKNFSISSIPRWRTYWGWDLGFSQVLVKSLGSVLQVVSTLADFGACVGTVYQIDRRVGLEAQLSGSFGYGFSSVSVLGQSLRLVVGATYYF